MERCVAITTDPLPAGNLRDVSNSPTVGRVTRSSMGRHDRRRRTWETTWFNTLPSQHAIMARTPQLNDDDVSFRASQESALEKPPENCDRPSNRIWDSKMMIGNRPNCGFCNRIWDGQGESCTEALLEPQRTEATFALQKHLKLEKRIPRSLVTTITRIWDQLARQHETTTRRVEQCDYCSSRTGPLLPTSSLRTSCCLEKDLLSGHVDVCSACRRRRLGLLSDQTSQPDWTRSAATAGTLASTIVAGGLSVALMLNFHRHSREAAQPISKQHPGPLL